MPDFLSRREWLLGAAGIAAARPKGVLVDSHVHLFDPQRVPYHPAATYRPPAAPLEAYVQFVREAGIDHTIIVHPEPYQDDHRYLEYCFEHEPSRGFFKGTCLFDPISPDTPARMQALVKKLPDRIVPTPGGGGRGRAAPPAAAPRLRVAAPPPAQEGGEGGASPRVPPFCRER